MKKMNKKLDKPFEVIIEVFPSNFASVIRLWVDSHVVKQCIMYIKVFSCEFDTRIIKDDKTVDEAFRIYVEFSQYQNFRYIQKMF